jgi:hypothetical protein
VPESRNVRFSAVDITSELQAHSMQARSTEPGCASCQRRLLPGETLHVYESGRALCTLCAPALPEEPLRRERVHAGTTRLAVVPRAA